MMSRCAAGVANCSRIMAAHQSSLTLDCDRERRAPDSRDTQIPCRTQIDVAEQAGLRQGYIANIEAGKKTSSAASLKAIAAALGVPLDVIVIPGAS